MTAHGNAGVFFANRAASGKVERILETTEGYLVLVRLSETDLAWVPLTSVVLKP